MNLYFSALLQTLQVPKSNLLNCSNCYLIIMSIHFTAVAPGPPPSLSVLPVNLTSVNISWSHLQCIEENGVIKFYRVEYGHESSTERVVVQVDIDTTMFTADRLDPSTTYEFQVRAINESNMSGSPNASVITTPSPKGKHACTLSGNMCFIMLYVPYNACRCIFSFWW